jgi:beta-galactosidase
LRWCELTWPERVLRIDADRVEPLRPGFSVTPWTAEQLAAARHWYELPAPEASWLYLDAAVHGLGSRSCGPDVRPEYQLWPRAAALSVRFSVGLRT